MQTFIFQDSEPGGLRSKSVAYFSLNLGMTLAHCLSERPGMLQFMCVLSSRSSCYFSHLCEGAQNFMKSCYLAQKQAYKLLKVISRKGSVYIGLLFCKYHMFFRAV